MWQHVAALPAAAAGGAAVVRGPAAAPVPLAANIAAQVGAPPPVAAVPANDWGQNRAFVAAPNPLNATVPGQVGDLGAVGLQILRVLRNTQANNPQAVADIDNIADYLRPIVAASNATRN